MTHYHFIINPTSGRGTGEKIYPELETILLAKGFDFAMQRTQSPGHATELAEGAAMAGSDVVVAVGGDGTANEVINGLAKASHSLQAQGKKLQTAMSVIPVGRGNDFAYGIGIYHDLETCVDILQQDRRKRIDVGLVQGGDYPEGRYFGNGVGIGFDAVVGFEALKLKRLHGFPSYIVGALKTIFLYFHAPKVQVEFYPPGLSTTLEQPALMVSVMNGRRLGGGFMMAPDGKTDDGLFNVTIADQVSRLAIFGLILKFMQGTQQGHPAIHNYESSHLSVTALDGSLPAHADGETLCTAGQRLELSIVPGLLEVVVPGE